MIGTIRPDVSVSMNFQSKTLPRLPFILKIVTKFALLEKKIYHFGAYQMELSKVILNLRDYHLIVTIQIKVGLMMIF
jgi:hypothetical protein